MEKIDYCHNNPITRALVERPEQWPWSSYNHYERTGESLVAMDWDGTWPLD